MLHCIIYGISMAHKSSGFPDPCSSNLVKNVKDGILRKECNINGRYVQRKNVVNNVDKSSLWAP